MGISLWTSSHSTGAVILGLTLFSMAFASAGEPQELGAAVAQSVAAEAEEGKVNEVDITSPDTPEMSDQELECLKNAGMLTASVKVPAADGLLVVGDAVCGDGSRANKNALARLALPEEECDDGNLNTGDGCDSGCLMERGYFCFGGTPCTADICRPHACGDYHRTGTEQCDDGNALDNDGCNRACELETGWTCTGGSMDTFDVCKRDVCGDGEVGEGEGCDDGNMDEGDGCSSACMVENYWECETDERTKLSTCQPICGDSHRTTIETCDDGNDVSGDGCDAVCQVEEGWECMRHAGEADTCTQMICGDARRALSEGCDDGNKVNRDGCSSQCTIEVGFTCTGGGIARADTCVPDPVVNEPAVDKAFDPAKLGEGAEK